MRCADFSQRNKKKCAIFNCNQKSRVIYNFPHYQHQKDLFMRWSSLCQNEEIQNMQPEDVNFAYGICDSHFEKEIVIIPELLPTVDLPGSFILLLIQKFQKIGILQVLEPKRRTNLASQSNYADCVLVPEMSIYSHLNIIRCY